ncbi:type II glyceraldehyde-3-phosphate dehydrogenase [Stieleria sp. ICT_E10.1]|uniref:type II glyceraldehyde-3-phosphate dehydrogenase n=1 Tax=Stieleria sedimenti TaxID=2976331 RepID=UPI00218039D5|nr:type II glyceraldehyde-3-phosphate dehydrogenase [Stieleria sedimenti]MCS7468884.1 type II glyceraldehyde-3-phosphate dehydrogenase [Stieleria sedimenti]
MSNVRVGILGYGVIGRRLADAVNVQSDMELTGISGRSNSFSLRDAMWQGYDIYVSSAIGLREVAARLPTIQGEFADLLAKIDVLLDCTPSGVPQQHRELLESVPNLVTIVQGGETSGSCEASFHSMTNFNEVAGEKRIRVISCSSTGTTRFLYALDRAFGVQQAFVTLTRRSADPGKLSKVPLNSLVPTMGPSHHARDVNSVFRNLRLASVSVNCPTTFGHVLHFQVDLQGNATRKQIIAALQMIPRVVVGRGIRSTAELAERYVELGRRRGDRPEIYVFEESLAVNGSTVMAAISVHMESITIPETVDCIRAALRRTDDPWESIEKTDRALGIWRSDASYSGPDRSLQNGGSNGLNANLNS